MRETITLNRKEQARLQVLNLMEKGELSAAEAAELVGLSVRQVRRILAAYREEGAAALAHGNRGRQPRHATAAEVREQVLTLAQTKYVGVNQQHLSELLAEQEQIRLSRSSVRRILLAAGLRSPRKRRPPKHRSRRERRAQEGMLLQVDGSRHDWLEGRGPWLTLVGGIDDATSTVPHALFRDAEDAQGYFLLLEGVVGRKGVPLALYHDQHGIFLRRPEEKATLTEQLAGEAAPTQFGRLLGELAIQSIPARSPQAKGRIERLWGTFQDRLVSELRLAGAATLAEANQLLAQFLPRYNARFAVPAASSSSAYRPAPSAAALAEMMAFKYIRTVAADNTVTFDHQTLQILPGKERASYVHAKVELHERMDGGLAVYYQGQCLATQAAPATAPVLRARTGPRPAAPQPTPPIAARHPIATKTQQPVPATSADHTHSPAAQAIATPATQPTKQPSKPAPNHPWRRPLRSAS